MTTEMMIESLRRDGVALAVRGEKLRADGPHHLLTAELVASLGARKAELTAFVHEDFFRAAGELLIRAVVEGAIDEADAWRWDAGFVDRVRKGDAPTTAEVYRQLAAEVEAAAVDRTSGPAPAIRD